MRKHTTKRFIAGLMALAVSLPAAVSLPVQLTASADEILREGTFDSRIYPWQVCEKAPAKQGFNIDDGALHLQIICPRGATDSNRDLEIKHSHLNFQKGHAYQVSFQVKAKREGMELYSYIGVGYNEYFVLNGRDGKNEMYMGHDMDGDWGYPVKLTTEYQTITGTFIPTEDITDAEWVFCYAADDKYGGNAEAGDELWFDNMSICCTTCDETGGGRIISVGRDFSGLQDNYISVNQIGYLPSASKIAVLGDNKGDVNAGASAIDLTKNKAYDFEVVNNVTGEIAYTGKTSSAATDADSTDTVCKIDFSELRDAGEYYIRIKGTTWRSFAFWIDENVYQESGHDLLTNALNYFYQNRSGCDIESKYITSGDAERLGHRGGHEGEKAAVQNAWVYEYADNESAKEGGKYYSSTIDASGGWYDAGDYTKSLIGGGIALWTLQNMYERSLLLEGRDKFADESGTVVVPESGNKVPDILDECNYELSFMQKMKVSADDPAWKNQAGLYYSKVQDNKWTGLAARPWDYDGPYDMGGWDSVRIVKPPTFSATLNYAACAAQAARLWKPYDEKYAQSLLDSAKDAYQAFTHHYDEADMTKTTSGSGLPCVKEAINPQSLYISNGEGEELTARGDYDVLDDAYWAACEIFISASEMDQKETDLYWKEVCDYGNAFKVKPRCVGREDKDTDCTYTAFTTDNPATAGSLALLLHRELLPAESASTLTESLLMAADDYIITEAEQGYGIPYKDDGPGTPLFGVSGGLQTSVVHGYEPASNEKALNNMIILASAYDLTNDQKYLDGVTAGMDYLLGTNPLSFSYITGYGSYHVQFPHHKYWAYEIDKEFPSAPDGVLVSGPSAYTFDTVMRLLGFIPAETRTPYQRSYFDDIEAWSVNEPSLSTNASLAWVVSFLQNDNKPVPVSNKPGDIDCSGTVDVADAVLLARLLAEDANITVSRAGISNADVNNSGSPDHEDIILILKHIARLLDLNDL